MRLRNILFPEGGKLRTFLRKYNRILKKIKYGKVPELNENQVYRNIIRDLEPKSEELEKQKNYKFKIEPKINIIIIEKYKKRKKYSKYSIRSVEHQTYSNWDLYVVKKKENVNDVIKNLTGDYVMFLKSGDLLPEFCLYEFVKFINNDSDAEFIYSDEDKFEEDFDSRYAPFFKPDFAIDTLRGNNYIGNASMIKKNLIDKISKFENTYDLNLKISEKTNKIKHIQKILYHSRQGTKIDIDADKDAIMSHLKRCELQAKVKYTEIQRNLRS